MKTQVIQVTPKMARDWLKSNTDNRPIRNGHVETLRASFERGEYVHTHQGIGFDHAGVLIDGQHRLSAIALLPEGSVFPMNVSFGMDRDAVFPVVDAVQAKRSTADALGIDRGLGEVANFFAKMYAARTNAVTPVYAQPFADWCFKANDEITAFCPRKCKTWSSAPVRAAAIVSMHIGIDRDYVKLVYRSLVAADFQTMPSIAQSIYRSHVRGNVRAAAAYDIFARCLKVFDPKFAKLTKVQINDQPKVIASVRDLLRAEIFGEKKKAPAAMTTGAKKYQTPANYRLEGL
jgi:hypothetical protein